MKIGIGNDHLFGQQTASKTRDKDYLVGMFR